VEISNVYGHDQIGAAQNLLFLPSEVKRVETGKI